MCDATTALISMLKGYFGHSVRFSVDEVKTRPWASVTFKGARSEITFQLEGSNAEMEGARFREALRGQGASYPEFMLGRGWILADLEITSGPAKYEDISIISVQALMVEE